MVNVKKCLMWAASFAVLGASLCSPLKPKQSDGSSESSHHRLNSLKDRYRNSRALLERKKSELTRVNKEIVEEEAIENRFKTERDSYDGDLTAIPKKTKKMKDDIREATSDRRDKQADRKNLIKEAKRMVISGSSKDEMKEFDRQILTLAHDIQEYRNKIKKIKVEVQGLERKKKEVSAQQKLANLNLHHSQKRLSKHQKKTMSLAKDIKKLEEDSAQLKYEIKQQALEDA